MADPIVTFDPQVTSSNYASVLSNWHLNALHYLQNGEDVDAEVTNRVFYGITGEYGLIAYVECLHRLGVATTESLNDLFLKVAGTPPYTAGLMSWNGNYVKGQVSLHDAVSVLDNAIASIDTDTEDVIAKVQHMIMRISPAGATQDQLYGVSDTIPGFGGYATDPALKIQPGNTVPLLTTGQKLHDAVQITANQVALDNTVLYLVNTHANNLCDNLDTDFYAPHVPYGQPNPNPVYKAFNNVTLDALGPVKNGYTAGQAIGSLNNEVARHKRVFDSVQGWIVNSQHMHSPTGVYPTIQWDTYPEMPTHPPFGQPLRSMLLGRLLGPGNQQLVEVAQNTSIQDAVIFLDNMIAASLINEDISMSMIMETAATALVPSGKGAWLFDNANPYGGTKISTTGYAITTANIYDWFQRYIYVKFADEYYGTRMWMDWRSQGNKLKGIWLAINAWNGMSHFDGTYNVPNCNVYVNFANAEENSGKFGSSDVGNQYSVVIPYGEPSGNPYKQGMQFYPITPATDQGTYARLILKGVNATPTKINSIRYIFEYDVPA